MFSFFSKKEYLTDYLEGFVDIHNHILPGIDDGAKNVEESIALIKGFAEFGVKNFICTPHIMRNYYDNTPKTIKKSFKKLNRALKEQNFTDVKLRYAAEHMIDDNFENILKKEKVLPIASNYMLIEMSYLQESLNFDSSIKKIKKRDLFPIFAHPERYIYLHNRKKTYQEIKSKGVLFQLNLLSLSGYYGTSIQKMAQGLLENNLYDFIGSDVHSMKHLDYLRENVKISNKTLDYVKPLIHRTNETFN
jgi:tyrosine-protein phosphatase YwqE